MKISFLPDQVSSCDPLLSKRLFSSVPSYTYLLFLLPPHPDGDVGTDLSAYGTSGAFLIPVPNDVEIALTIDHVSDPN